MSTTKKAPTKAPKTPPGKGSSTEAKTNEDFNKKTPQKDDPMLKVKQVKK